MPKAKLRGNRPELRLAWRGRVKDRHRSMLRELMDDLGFDESKIQRLDTEIASRVDLAALSRLTTIPGIDLITAWTLLAELGTDMSVFASPRHGCVAHSVRRHGRQPARRTVTSPRSSTAKPANMANAQSLVNTGSKNQESSKDSGVFEGPFSFSRAARSVRKRSINAENWRSSLSLKFAK